MSLYKVSSARFEMHSPLGVVTYRFSNLKVRVLEFAALIFI